MSSPDPFITGYLAQLSAALTEKALKAAGRKLKEAIAGTPKEQALGRCYHAGAIALLPEHPDAETWRPVLQEFFEHPVAQVELAQLIRGQAPNQDRLAELWEDEINVANLPPFDFTDRFAAFTAAFLQNAEQEPDLQGIIQTAHLREQTARLRAIAGDTAAIRRAVQIARESKPAFQTGDVKVKGDLYAENVNTGFQVIVKQPPRPADPCPDLRQRYLRGLQKATVELPLAAMDDEGADSRSANVTLDRVYIALNTQSQVKLSKAEKEQPELRSRDTRPLTAMEAAAQNKRLVLLGEPGSGKSVFVNYLAYLNALELLHPKASAGESAPLVPIRIILRDLAATLADRLDLTRLGEKSVEAQKKALQSGVKAYLLNQLTGLNVGDSNLLPRRFSDAEAEKLLNCLSAQPSLIIFDGLDEVSLEHLPWARQLIQNIAAVHAGQVIVTCRIRSYQGMAPLPAFSAETLAPFTSQQIDDFIEAWYGAQRALTPQQRQARIANMKGAVRGKGLPELAQNPLLLTTMALIHTAGIGLPRQRVKLYERSVEVLMRRWQKHKYGQASLLDQVGITGGRLLQGLRALAYHAHQTTQKGESADIDGDRAIGILARVCFNNDTGKAGLFLGYVDRQAGLLVGQGGSETLPPVYKFAHRTFQEYLAGCHLALAEREGFARALLKKLPDGERWYLAAQLGAEHLLYNVNVEYPALEALYKLCPAQEPQNESDWRGAVWAGTIAAEMGADWIAGDDAPDGGQSYLARLYHRLRRIIEQGLLNVAERGDAGDALAALNADARPGVNVFQPPSSGKGKEGEELPNLRFCYIPAGPFWMGNQKEKDSLAYDDEYGHSAPLNLSYSYWLARYPVTQAQYRVFIRDTGHRAPFKDADWARAYNWQNNAPPAAKRNHPVALVSWRDAVAYAAWLTERGQGLAKERALKPDTPSLEKAFWQGLAEGELVFRLPTEAEWEKGARGGLEIPVAPVILGLDGYFSLPPTTAKTHPNSQPQRRWPWGEWGEDSPIIHANVLESRRGQTMSVGSFPAGESPYGCLDMSGNVWEWTRSLYKKYPYQEDDGREDPQASGTRTVRGGSWYFSLGDARVSVRYNYHPDDFFNFIGFRLVLAPALKLQ